MILFEQAPYTSGPWRERSARGEAVRSRNPASGAITDHEHRVGVRLKHRMPPLVISMTPVQQLDISFRDDFDMRLDSIDRRTVLLVRGELCPEHRPRDLPVRFATYEAVWVDPGACDRGSQRNESNGLQYRCLSETVVCKEQVDVRQLRPGNADRLEVPDPGGKNRCGSSGSFGSSQCRYDRYTRQTSCQSAVVRGRLGQRCLLIVSSTTLAVVSRSPHAANQTVRSVLAPTRIGSTS